MLLYSENLVILASVVLSQYTRITDDRQHIMTIVERCNATATSAKVTTQCDTCDSVSQAVTGDVTVSLSRL